MREKLRQKTRRAGSPEVGIGCLVCEKAENEGTTNAREPGMPNKIRGGAGDSVYAAGSWPRQG